MNNPDMYYQESGTLSAKGILYTLGAGVVGAAVLGAVYAYASYYIPFIYLNLILCVVLGVGVGWLVGKASYLGEVRNQNFLMAVAVGCGLLAMYFAWIFWLYAWTDQELLSYNPGGIFDMMGLISVTGIWSIFGATPTGFGLYAIWIIEALIVIIAALLLALGSSGREPYCEDCENWTKETNLTKRVEPITNPAALISSLEQRDMSVLTAMNAVPLTDNHRTKIDLVKCPNCSNAHYLTVEAIEASYDDDGKLTENETTIVENIKLNQESYDQVKRWGEVLGIPA